MYKLFKNFTRILIFTLPGIGSLLHAGQFRYTDDPYSTHQPVLYDIAKKTTGAIIEFGCGYGSTDMLHEICKQEGRLLISIDDNLEWLTKFSDKYKGDGYEEDNSGWHKFYFVPGKDSKDPENPAYWVQFLNDLDLLKTTFFDLCFIDQSPWLARWETVKHMKGSSRYVIVHDCDYFPMKGVFGSTIKPIANEQPGVFDFSDVFQFFRVYFPLAPWPGPTGPPTLLGSDFDSDLPDVDFNR